MVQIYNSQLLIIILLITQVRIFYYHIILNCLNFDIKSFHQQVFLLTWKWWIEWLSNSESKIAWVILHENYEYHRRVGSGMIVKLTIWKIECCFEVQCSTCKTRHIDGRSYLILPIINGLIFHKSSCKK